MFVSSLTTVRSARLLTTLAAASPLTHRCVYVCVGGCILPTCARALSSFPRKPQQPLWVVLCGGAEVHLHAGDGGSSSGSRSPVAGCSELLWVCDVLSELSPIRVVVREDSDVVLNCSTSGTVRDQVFDWKKDGGAEVFIYARGRTYGEGMSGQDAQFTGRVEHFPEALDSGNASIKIKQAKVLDSGSYTCEVPPLKRSHVSLVVGEFLHKHS